MNDFKFSLTCSKCDNGNFKLDDYAIDTQTCYKKHVFFLKCDLCDNFTATAMGNIPLERWHEFMSAEKITEIKTKLLNVKH
jgi:hypothetical protein